MQIGMAFAAAALATVTLATAPAVPRRFDLANVLDLPKLVGRLPTY